jgi:hypothetical protein
MRTPVLRPWMAKNIDMCIPSFVHRVGVVEAGCDSAYRPRRKSAHALPFLAVMPVLSFERGSGTGTAYTYLRLVVRGDG